MQSNLVKCTWNLARISMHLFKLCTYPKLGIMQSDLQFGLSLSDLRCFRENTTKLSLDLRQLPCEVDKLLAVDLKQRRRMDDDGSISKNDIKSVNHAWNEAQQCQQNIDRHIGSKAAGLHGHSDWLKVKQSFIKPNSSV
ncbi:hypothetical protein T11_15602 [Trichinella zimbabwensis]|uniref:Uncharacterized protein n=1 Tax=Trichinella zimbabwensis TaxID=268475 RepID=A0A0V1H7F0_9BILA|nr:hypothetical protein T11_15602 [Trichinella zimbabwensis]